MHLGIETKTLLKSGLKWIYALVRICVPVTNGSGSADPFPVTNGSGSGSNSGSDSWKLTSRAENTRQ
jgi:hypothetical protein